MPIRLNLLAEAQAEEEMRRRDPVKRAIWVGGFLVACVLLYFVVLFIATLTKRAELGRFQARMEAHDAQYQQLADNEKKLVETIHRLQALNQMAGKRFLWGTVLNALQKASLDDVQLMRFRGDQAYAVTEEVKPKTSDSGRVTLGKPGYVTERVTLTFDAKDNSEAPGDRINKYKAALEAAPYFGKAAATTTNKSGITATLKNLSAPSFDSASGKSVVFFSLECRLPDKFITLK